MIRAAAPNDAGTLAAIHAEGWATTYRGILPDAVVDQASQSAARLPFWTGMLASPPERSILLIGEDENGIAQGFAFGGPERSGTLGCGGELYAIYLRPAARGRGLGGSLVREIARGLAARGFESMAVWVLDANPYRRFYEKLDGIRIASKTVEFEGTPFGEIAYGWERLLDLDA